MRLVPIYDNIIVQRTEEPDRTKGGIFLPDAAKQRRAEGKVIAVGPGKPGENGSKPEPLPLTVDETVVFSAYVGTDVELAGQKYVVLKAEDILAKIEGGDETDALKAEA